MNLAIGMASLLAVCFVFGIWFILRRRLMSRIFGLTAIGSIAPFVINERIPGTYVTAVALSQWVLLAYVVVGAVNCLVFDKDRWLATLFVIVCYSLLTFLFDNLP